MLINYIVFSERAAYINPRVSYIEHSRLSGKLDDYLDTQEEHVIDYIEDYYDGEVISKWCNRRYLR